VPIEFDYYERWKRCELRAEKGIEATHNTIKYLIEQRNRYLQISQLAIDSIFMHASSHDWSVYSVRLVICSSLEGDLYQPNLWRQYNAYDSGRTLALSREMRQSVGR
jgi:hypothetical protein